MNTLAFQHVLWKDWHQIRRPLLLVTVLLSGPQLLILVAHALGIRFAEDILPLNRLILFNIASLVPAFVATAVAGQLVGMERQNCTWNWSSSLPVGWHRGLASLFCQWLIGVILVGTPVFALALAGQLALGPERAPTLAEQLVALSLAGVIGLEVLIWLSITALIVNESVTGFVVAIMLLCWYQVTMAYASVESSIPTLPGHLFRVENLNTWLAPIRVFSLIAGFSLCLALFRWRWNSGQFWHCSLRWWRVAGTHTPLSPGAWTGVFAAEQATPGRLRGTLAHAIRVAGPFRLAIVSVTVLTALVCGWITSRQLVVQSELVVLPLTVAVCLAPLVAIATFSADHYRQQYRYMADRGWNPLLVTTWRVATTLLVVLLMFGVAWASPQIAMAISDPHYLFDQSLGSISDSLMPVLGICCIAMLASLCFPSVIVAFCVLLMTLVFGAMGLNLFFHLAIWPLLDRGDQLTVLNWVYVIMIAGSLASCGLGVRQWLVRYRFAGGWWYAVTLTAIVIAIGMACLIAVAILG